MFDHGALCLFIMICSVIFTCKSDCLCFFRIDFKFSFFSGVPLFYLSVLGDIRRLCRSVMKLRILRYHPRI